MDDFYGQPEMVTKLQEAIVPHAIAIGKTLIDAGAEYIFYGADMECPLLISVDHYHQFVHGPTKKVVKALADMGGKVLPHMCGQIVKKGTVDLLMEMDIKGIMPGNLTQDTVLDINRLKEKVQDRICIFGNLNPNGSLLMGTPEEVKNETRSHLEKARGMCGYIFSTAGTASITTPTENFEAMNQVVINFK